jgi:hypothetical protein
MRPVLREIAASAFSETDKLMLKVQSLLTLCFGRLLKARRLLCAWVMELQTR